MATINLRDFYPWYTHDEFVEVPDIIAEELFADRRYQKSHRQRIKRNKAYYSLDAGDGIENSAIHMDLSPYEIMERQREFCRLCRALNSLPETLSIFRGSACRYFRIFGMLLKTDFQHQCRFLTRCALCSNWILSR